MMSDQNYNIGQPSDFSSYINMIQKKIGTKLLSDDDLVALALYEISRTFTRDERDYK